jgi:uroporphyrinogen-III synthase
MTGLEGKTILVTRPSEQANDLAGAIERVGGRVIVIPSIAITDPETWDSCDEAIRKIRSYDGLIFTSANAATRFFGRCKIIGTDQSGFQSLRIFVVGTQTARTVREHGLPVEGIPEHFTAASLGKHLGRYDIAAKRFLLPRGDRSGDALIRSLKAMNAEVDAPVVYRTVDVDADLILETWRHSCGEGVDVLTFASPSAVKSFLNAVPAEVLVRYGKVPRIAVIGPATAAAAKEFGLHIEIVADESTSAGLVDALLRYYQSSS